jgi:hypothetical protein
VTVNWHPSEDELVLHYYGELAADAEAAVVSHLAGCARCGAAWRELTDALRSLATAGSPEPRLGLEDAIWARVRPALPGRARWFRQPVVVVGALAAVLVAAFATASLWLALSSRGPAPDPDTAASRPADPSGARERVLLTALNDHFSQAEILLVELMNTRAAGSSAWEFQRSTADDLVTSGRLYRQTARQTGDLHFANMLDDLEGVLVEVAAAPVERTDVDFLREQIEDDALLFKVRAVATEIRGRQRQLMQP